MSGVRPTFATRVRDTLLGTDRKQRGYVSRTMLAGAIGIVMILSWGAASSIVAGPAYFGQSLRIAVCAGLGEAVAYALLRSGWSRRFRDPALTTLQMVFAVFLQLWLYSLGGPLRGLAITMTALVPIFGMQGLKPSQARAVGGLAALALTALIATMSHLDPERFDPRLEVLHAVLVLTCIPTIGVLVGVVCAMRERLRAQRTALRDALAGIEVYVRYDPLTGLVNRREMLARLQHETQRQQRNGGVFSVALIDIDHFKRINDTHGHAAGDWVLKRFAQGLRAALREGDVLARWGGEEFLLLMPASDARDAVAVVERLRQGLAAAPFWAERPELRATFSAGVEAHREDDVARTVDAADRALYRAKAAGRDRVEAAR